MGCVGRLLLRGHGDDLAPSLRGENRRMARTGRILLQPRDAKLEKASTPAGCGSGNDSQGGCDLKVLLALCGQKHDLRPQHQPGRDPAPASVSLQLRRLLVCQNNPCRYPHRLCPHPKEHGQEINVVNADALH